MIATRPRRKATRPAPPPEDGAGAALGALAVAAVLFVANLVGIAVAIGAAAVIGGFWEPFFIAVTTSAAAAVLGVGLLERVARAGGWRR